MEKALQECQAQGSSKSLLQDLVTAAGSRVAAIAALDMFLVGIDTVKSLLFTNIYDTMLIVLVSYYRPGQNTGPIIA